MCAQVIVDVHQMLRYVECERAAGAGADAVGAVGAARAAQVALFAAQLDHLELRLRAHQQTPKLASLLTTGGCSHRDLLPSVPRLR